jgi:hypothetical protein
MNIRQYIKEHAQKALAEVSKQDFTPIFMHMHPSDRKTIRYWNVSKEGNIAVIRFYSTLIGQGLLEFITEFTDKQQGAFRLYPDDSLICIEIKVPTK